MQDRKRSGSSLGIVGVIVTGLIWYFSSPDQPSHWFALIACSLGIVVLAVSAIASLVSKKKDDPQAPSSASLD